MGRDLEEEWDVEPPSQADGDDGGATRASTPPDDVEHESPGGTDAPDGVSVLFRRLKVCLVAVFLLLSMLMVYHGVVQMQVALTSTTVGWLLILLGFIVGIISVILWVPPPKLKPPSR